MKVEIDTELESAQEIQRKIELVQSYLKAESTQSSQESGYVDMFSAPEPKKESTESSGGMFDMFGTTQEPSESAPPQESQSATETPEKKEKISKEILDQVREYY